MGFPGGTNGKEPACQCKRCKRLRFNPRVGKIPWRRAWQPTPVFLPGESHGRRSLGGCRHHQDFREQWAASGSKQTLSPWQEALVVLENRFPGIQDKFNNIFEILTVMNKFFRSPGPLSPTLILWGHVFLGTKQKERWEQPVLVQKQQSTIRLD